MTQLDLHALRDDAIADDTRAFNEQARERLSQTPLWTPHLAAGIREARARGGGRFPRVVKSPRAQDREIPGPAGPLRVRIIAPKEPRGIYLHFHGGGWYMGGADLQDEKLEAIADGAALICISVDYRLSPEHPYPAASDDCEAAALWVLEKARGELGVNAVTIGGESAGAQLAAVTLLRLRDKLGLTLKAANLVFGFFDLNLTPGARRFGDHRYTPRTSDLRSQVAAFVGPDHSLASPDISPLYGDLSRLCPALFTIGTNDPLLDDSLFMHMRWIVAGNRSELRVYPGGIHSFTLGNTQIARQAEQAMIEFLRLSVAA